MSARHGELTHEIHKIVSVQYNQNRYENVGRICEPHPSYSIMFEFKYQSKHQNCNFNIVQNNQIVAFKTCSFRVIKTMLFILILFICCKLELACLMGYDTEQSDSNLSKIPKKISHEQIINNDTESRPSLEIALRYFELGIRKHVSSSGSDFSVIIHLLTYLSIALFDSIAPYERYAIGIIR